MSGLIKKLYRKLEIIVKIKDKEHSRVKLGNFRLKFAPDCIGIKLPKDFPQLPSFIYVEGAVCFELPSVFSIRLYKYLDSFNGKDEYLVAASEFMTEYNEKWKKIKRIAWIWF